MRETGVIVSIAGNLARVRMAKGVQCAGCKACSAFGETSMELEVRNNLHAQLGERVEVEINPQQVVGHSLLLFVVPILLLMVGYLLGFSFNLGLPISRESQGIVAGLVFLAGSFLGLRLYDRFYAKSGKVMAEIVARCNEPVISPAHERPLVW